MRSRFRVLAAGMAAVGVLTAAAVGAVLAYDAVGRDFGEKPPVVAVIEEQTGIRGEADLRARLAGGETLAELITAEGGDADAVVAVALAGLDVKLAKLIEAGEPEAAQAAEYRAGAEQRVRDWLAGRPSNPQGQPPWGQGL